MPYLKVKQGNKWCIYKEKDGKKTGPSLGCHATEEKANKQLSALHANVVEGMMKKKEIEETQDAPAEAEESYPAYEVMDRADVPWGARSFEDVAAAREATKLMERLENHTNVFYTLFWRIWRDSDIPMEEKTAAWENLMGDFFTAFNDEMAAEESAMAELEEFKENVSGSIIRLSESDKQNAEARQPLEMDIAVIEPGFGNPKDNHYYPAEVLRRDAHIFEGAKMYATDHRPEEKSVRTEVGKVEKIIGFTETGAPKARVKIWNPDFAEDVRNREKMSELSSLECSILAKGKARKGEVDGKKTNIVEAIVASKHTNVDFVTSAGAGGRALQLVESDKEATMPKQDEAEITAAEEETTEEVQEAADVTLHEQEETEETEETDSDETEEIEESEDETEDEPIAESEEVEPILLAEAEVSTLLDNSKLPAISKARLAKEKYLNEVELQNAIQSETDYIKELVGAGEVMGLGASDTAVAELDTAKIAKRHQERIDEILFSN